VTPNDPLSSSFAAAFKQFIDAMNAEAAKEPSPLFERLREYLGTDPTKAQVVAEEFDNWEHPNIQVALDAVLSKPARRSELIGIAAQNKRFGGVTFSDLLSAGGPWGRPLTEGPVDYVNFNLEDGKVLTCVQYGLFLVTDGDDRFTVYIAGPPSAQMGPQSRMRIEIAGTRRDRAASLLKEITAAMRERNVYRGNAISLAPGQFGVQGLVKFHRLPRVSRADIVLPDGTHVQGDFTWWKWRLVIEVDGFATHGTRRGMKRDRVKDRALRRAGWRVERFTWDEVMLTPRAVRAELPTFFVEGMAA